jgi:cyanate lyase
MLSKLQMTEAIIQAKLAKGYTWASIAEAAGLHEVYVTSACLGMNHLDKVPPKDCVPSWDWVLMWP